MEKRSNNNIYEGVPKYLDLFKLQDENLPKQKCLEVVDGTFDYAAERKMILKMIEDKMEFARANRPMTKKALDNRPPIGDHIAHIEKRYGIDWVHEPVAVTNFRDAHQNNE